MNLVNLDELYDDGLDADEIGEAIEQDRKDKEMEEYDEQQRLINKFKD